jgi:hypothetical protein
MTLKMVAYRITFDYDDHEICLPGAMRRIADITEQLAQTGSRIDTLGAMDKETGVEFFLERTQSFESNEP